MRIVYLAHSLLSCWNHGNAHFLRGLFRDLIARGHDVSILEPASAWSLQNLLADHGEAGLAAFRSAYPELDATTFSDAEDAAALCADADLVVVHEWTDPALVARLGRARRQGGRFILLFHDTHHRAVSDPQAIDAFELDDFDGILAFGETLSEVYRGWGWSGRVWTWHEAADTELFRPRAEAGARSGIVWIGNWGDGERTEELETFLFRPTAACGLSLDVYGVRYPDAALGMLRQHGARYRGWLPNAQVPEVFGRHRMTVHVPRRFYVDRLPGIPTIRVFEALACGIPLVCAPWIDSENLFRPGQDYLVARTGAEMEHHLRAVNHDPALRDAMVASGLETIRARHTCAHRVDELLAIVRSISPAFHPGVSERPVETAA